MDIEKLKKQRKDREKKRFKGHGVQFNLPEAAEMYSPARDFAHNYPVMIQSIIRAFNRDYWPQLFGRMVTVRMDEDEHERLLDFMATLPTCKEDLIGEPASEQECSELAFDDVERAKDAFCSFLNHSCDNPDESVEEVLERVGWHDIPVDAQMTWMAMLGQVMTGQLFAGIRDLTPQGGKGGKIENVRHFIDEGHKARRALNGLTDKTEAANIVREAARAARRAGYSFAEIAELVKDVEHGRV